MQEEGYEFLCPRTRQGERRAMLALLLPQLPDDILLLLFSYADAQALGRLSQVCRRFQRLINRDTLWRSIARVSLNTGLTRLGRDAFPQIALKERVKASRNWKHGRCRQEVTLRWKCDLLPWLQLDQQWLYLSQASDIRAYSLRRNGTGLRKRPVAVYTGHQDDVCRFVLNESQVVSGGGDGKIIVYDTCNSFCTEYSAHNQEVNCIDSRGHVIVSGSRDKTARIWSLDSNRLGECLHTIRTEDRVWSIAISPTLSSVMTGTACCGHASPLRIWDLQSGHLESSLGSDFRRGAGVLDILYESPTVVLSCGYDSYIRQWDTRAGTRDTALKQALQPIVHADQRSPHTRAPSYTLGTIYRSQLAHTPAWLWTNQSTRRKPTVTGCTNCEQTAHPGSNPGLWRCEAAILRLSFRGWWVYGRSRQRRRAPRFKDSFFPAVIRRCVSEWEEPHDSALYCLQTDGNHMIASGSSHYGVVRLWDRRQSKSLQMFFLSSPNSSPVYCLRFTTSHLYAALAYALYTLDFTSSNSWLAK
ncbi:F-box/WD repeat-containing protein 4 isoform X1 [Rhinoraja longicauda]